MKRLTVLVAAALVAVPAFASATSYTLDTAHSAVGFTIPHFGISKVKGGFATFTGTAEYDPKAPDKLAFTADIDAASIDTDHEKRDGHLKSPDFFDVAKFPKLTFKSKSAKAKGAGKWDVKGDLTIRGVTKEIVLAVEGLQQAMKDFEGKERRAASATGKINRKDFGLTWNKALEAGGVVVGEEVTLNIEVELVEKK